MTRRPLVFLVSGAILRLALPYLARLADALDPAGNVGQAWRPRVTVPDYVPDALTSDR